MIQPADNGLFEVIYADPAWHFKVYSEKTGAGRSASKHYQTMNVDQICALNVPASKSCALFLWATWPMLPQAFKVIDAWGFTYRSLAFEWWKLNKHWPKALPKVVETLNPVLIEKLFTFGMGYYTRACSEPCLLAVRGSMPVASHSERNFIVSPIREHSAKPYEAYRKIERLYPHARKLEMFAREKFRPGWKYWGNEIQSDVIIT